MTFGSIFGSLRARLIAIILAPLLLIALAAGAWQFVATSERAEGIFDRGLLSAALAISRDVAISDGDALSPTTRRLINDTSGGELFYHVFAPDGVFVTGYSTPPVARRDDAPADRPFTYDATYQGEAVRVLKFPDVTTVTGVSGTYTITVWQRAEVRSRFVRDVLRRSLGIISALVASVALVVWFGVGYGLRPLLDLEQAIARRTPSELTPIRRTVPVEARSLVETLNGLLDRISRRISSKDEFISSAAHQLRNPIAGILALAEAVQAAKTMAASRERSADLIHAAREAKALTDQLLSFERVSGTSTAADHRRVDLAALIHETADAFASRRPAQNIDVAVHTETASCPTIPVMADDVMLREALLNLLTNATTHGGKGLSRIDVTLARDPTHAFITITDDGIGIAPDMQLVALSRFGQIDGGPGSGLGLPIASRIMETHNGHLEFLPGSAGTTIRLALPLV